MKYWSVKQAAIARRQTPRSQSLTPSTALIAAVDLDGGFSKDGEIPWHFPADMKFFKQLTTGHIVVIGRTTYEDINQKMGDKGLTEVLPGRITFVVSTTLLQDNVKNAIVIPTPQAALDHTTTLSNLDKIVFFAGGMGVFKYGLTVASQLFLTIVNDSYGCDLRLPTTDIVSNFSPATYTRSDEEPLIVFTTWKRHP